VIEIRFCEVQRRGSNFVFLGTWHRFFCIHAKQRRRKSDGSLHFRENVKSYARFIGYRMILLGGSREFNAWTRDRRMDDALIAASHSFWKFLFKQNFLKIQIYKKKLCIW